MKKKPEKKYFFASIFDDQVYDEGWVGGTYQEAYDAARKIVVPNEAIVAAIIYSNHGTAIVIKRIHFMKPIYWVPSRNPRSRP